MSSALVKDHVVPSADIPDGESVCFCSAKLAPSKEPKGRFFSVMLLTVIVFSVVSAVTPISVCAQTPGAAAPVEVNVYRESEAGWLESEVYRSPAEDPVRVEFLDVLVGAGRIASVKAMPSAALLDVKAGQASVSVDRQQQRSTAGTVIRIEPGQALSIDNRKSERSFVARLIRISAAR